jgi:diguanylate cyclase (GGDEF)-like protein
MTVIELLTPKYYKLVNTINLVLIIILSAITLLLPQSVYTGILKPYEIFAVLCIISILLLFIKAIIDRHKYAMTLVAGIVFLLISIYYEVFISSSVSYIPIASYFIVVLFSIIVIGEIESLIVRNEELIEEVNIDRLTKIHNRTYFENEVNRLIEVKTIFSIIIFDLDYFKNINDEFGHSVGDVILRESSRLIKNFLGEKIGERIVFARWGGEEFVILGADFTYIQMIYLAESIRELLENNDFKEVGRVTASFGVATYCDNDQLADVVKRADDALYKAKRSGRNQVGSIECNQ